jgi:hypothetical protein
VTTLVEYEESEVGRRRQYDAWNRVAQAVQSHLDQTVGCARAQILSQVNRFARRILGVEEVSVDTHGRVLTGRSPALLSASQAWLLGIAVMAAIAVRAKAPILVLDGADILDDQNKVALIRWLMTEICPNLRIPSSFPPLGAINGIKSRYSLTRPSGGFRRESSRDAVVLRTCSKSPQRPVPQLLASV